jgi:phosphatidylglycerophosphate synthase
VGHYRARDLLLPPSLVSFARIPLAAAFVGFAHQPSWALGVLLLAGITDVLDGHLARRLGQATPMVAWWALHEDGRRARAEDPRANWVGKAATVCQFLAIAALLIRGEASYFWLALTAITGVASAVAYWRRELRATARTDAKAH